MNKTALLFLRSLQYRKGESIVVAVPQSSVKQMLRNLLVPPSHKNQNSREENKIPPEFHGGSLVLTRKSLREAAQETAPRGKLTDGGGAGVQ